MARRRKKRLPEEPVQAHIESLSHECRGVAHIDGKITFISRALPGEEVMFRYTSKRRSHDEGDAIEVLTPSADRVEPRCPHYGICGGCSLQHMDENKQIEAKQTILKEHFQHLGQKLEIPELLPPLSAQRWGYRRKARLGVRYVSKKGKVLVGFRERSSNFIAELSRCEVLHPSVGEHLTDLAEVIQSLTVFDQIPQIEVAVGDNATALIFRHLAPLSEEDRASLSRLGEQKNYQIYLQPKGPDTIELLYPQQAELIYRLDNYQVDYRFLPSDFTQVNQEMNIKMVEQALSLLQPAEGERILDLFCGLGNFTLPIARSAAEVVGVEGDAALVQRAQQNAKRNGIDNAEFHLFDLTAEVVNSPWAKGGFEKVLLDPPRSGAMEVLPLLPKLGVKRLVYVSCNPATLARDAGILVHQLGYSLKCAGVMDMFPHTGHVESIALFEKN